MNIIYFLILMIFSTSYAMEINRGTLEKDNLEQAWLLYQKGKYQEAKEKYERGFEEIEEGDIVIIQSLFQKCDRKNCRVYTLDQLCNDKTNYGQCCWALGDYRTGHQCFDARLEHSDKLPLIKPLTEQKLSELVANKELGTVTLLVRAEHNASDTLAFIKWLKSFKKEGVKVILQVQEGLKSLISRSTDCVNIVIDDLDIIPPFDYDMYLMSVPRFVSLNGIKPTEVAGDIPHLRYVCPLKAKIKQWNNELAGSVPLGICWANDDNKVIGGRTLKRNIPLRILAQLATLHGVKLYNLQPLPHKPISRSQHKSLRARNTLHGLTKGDILPAEYKVYTLDKLVNTSDTYEELAAIMVAMHMLKGGVVSVDSPVLHLAGALGIQAIGLLADHANTDARWGTLYPGTRLEFPRLYKREMAVFSKPAPGQGGWQKVIDNVKENLATFYND